MNEHSSRSVIKSIIKSINKHQSYKLAKDTFISQLNKLMVNKIKLLSSSFHIKDFC